MPLRRRPHTEAPSALTGFKANRKGRVIGETDVATSQRMSRIRQSKTAAEQSVSRILRHLGHSYRYSNRDLPGSPDLANRKWGWVVFVHGCFWHSHSGCARATVPARNRQFWLRKFEANRKRDARAARKLRALGFEVITIWECEISENPRRVKSRLERHLGRTSGQRAL